MKKNKGFSLVELIIVIAIMAILAAAIAPALIRYIDKSRKADDVTAAGTIQTAVQSAISNEAAYDEVMAAIPANGTVDLLSATAGATGFGLINNTAPTGVTNSAATFIREVNSNIGGEVPKLKYRKQLDGRGVPSGWIVGISSNGKPVVYISDSSSNKIQVQPVIDPSYQ